MFDPIPIVAGELGVSRQAVAGVIALLDGGATVPFIARYRKEATAGLDEVQIRAVRDRRAYLVELKERRGAVLSEIQQQGKLTAELRAQIEAAQTKSALEDLYAPFKTKRRTRAVIARERGLEPLAARMWAQGRDGAPRKDAAAFVSRERGVEDVDQALAGARDICAERVADHPPVRAAVREIFEKHAVLSAKKTRAHKQERTKFDDHVGRPEAAQRIASHRYLAIRRGENEGVLKVDIDLDDSERLRERIGRIAGLARGSPWHDQLRDAIEDAYARLIAPRAAAELHAALKERAEAEAVEVFAKNLRELLLGAPFGAKPVLGIDPGQRTGCKCAAVSASGKLLESDTLFLVHGDAKVARARETLLGLCRKHRVAAIAVGNGTHGRETEAFAREVMHAAGQELVVVSVSEAGASVYSASDVARDELPDVDVTVRGAVSIARRLQDPLAELVKVEPKSIGVGQYQHDVHQPLLGAKLAEVVEDCVNRVGVDLNTASGPLLSYVAGLGPAQAKRVVAHRHENGPFRRRRQLLDVSGFGPKTFEQAAGFLRIRDGEDPLDGSAVHPERYALVARIARDQGIPVKALVGDAKALSTIDKARYLGDDVGAFTIDDILGELAKPGRDPRARFEPPRFRDDVRSLDDLKDGMELEGVVTNVTAFGAFVDVGVKQDGLVHVSQLADRFVKDPSDVVKVGDRLQVRVLGVDRDRKRISLSARRQKA